MIGGAHDLISDYDHQTNDYFKKNSEKANHQKKKMQTMIFTGNLPLKIFDIEGEANFIAIEFFVDHKGIRSQTEYQLHHG